MYEHMLNWFCDETGEDYFQLRSRRRNARSVETRRIAACFFRELGLSYPQIGEALNRDHSSVLHLCRTASEAEREKAEVLAQRWSFIHAD